MPRKLIAGQRLNGGRLGNGLNASDMTCDLIMG